MSVQIYLLFLTQNTLMLILNHPTLSVIVVVVYSSSILFQGKTTIIIVSFNPVTECCFSFVPGIWIIGFVSVMIVCAVGPLIFVQVPTIMKSSSILLRLFPWPPQVPFPVFLVFAAASKALILEVSVSTLAASRYTTGGGVGSDGASLLRSCCWSSTIVLRLATTLSCMFLKSF